MTDLKGDERYILEKGVIHKLDMDNKPDKAGMKFHLIREEDDGYIVYLDPVDPSQPSPQFFIHKKYFTKRGK